MQKRGWYLVAFCVLAGACEKNEQQDDASVPVAGQAGTMASAGSSNGPGPIAVGGVAGIGAAPSGGRSSVDLSSVQMPVVRCAAMAAGGAGEDSAGGAAGSAASEMASGAGGAAWDETCAPPRSTCLRDITLVYFDEGECVEGFCEWQKRSLDCISSCFKGGCQDSITTK